MRDRLKKLLMTDVECNKDGHGDCSMCEYKYADDKCAHYLSAIIADYLLANGVIVPPCKVGDTVWVYNQTTNNIYRNTVIGIKIFGTGKNANKIIVKYVNQRGETSDRKFAWSQIGKQVFLSEEEAVQALVERSGK